MIIGIYLGQLYETEGGGFTFQESIIEKFLMTPTEHQFVFFYSGANIFKNKDLGSHLIARLVPNTKLHSFLFRRFQFLRKHVIKWMRAYYPRQSVLTYFDWWAKKYRIQLLWLTAFRHLDTDIPYIYTIWDLQHRLQPFFPEVSANGQWRNRDELLKKMTRRAAYVITGTSAGKKELQLFYGIPDERIRLLLHPTPPFALQHRDKLIPLTLKVPDVFVFYPAQFWPHKNHNTLLKAIHHLKKEQNRIVNVVLVGHDYGYKSFVEQKAQELDIKDQVFIFGFVERQQLISLYQHTTALTYVSHFGPENLPPLEAMALGCPVLNGKVNGAEEQLGDAVHFVDNTSYESIANGIARILDDKQLRTELINNGYKRAALYTTDHYVSDLLKVFGEFAPLRECWH